MNGVDGSDQILSTFSVHRKAMKWWKAVFYHLVDMAVVNSYILFLEHRAQNPHEEALRRPAGYTQAEFREEIIRDICEFPEYGDPPLCDNTRRDPDRELYDSTHMPIFTDERKNCVVCYKLRKICQNAL